MANEANQSDFPIGIWKFQISYGAEKGKRMMQKWTNLTIFSTKDFKKRDKFEILKYKKLSNSIFKFFSIPF